MIYGRFGIANMNNIFILISLKAYKIDEVRKILTFMYFL